MIFKRNPRAHLGAADGASYYSVPFE